MKEAETDRLANENGWIYRGGSFIAAEGFSGIPSGGDILYRYDPGVNELGGLSVTTECCISQGGFK